MFETLLVWLLCAAFFAACLGIIIQVSDSDWQAALWMLVLASACAVFLYVIVQEKELQQRRHKPSPCVEKTFSIERYAVTPKIERRLI